MRKIDGLKFLQQHFLDLTVDCLFVDRAENLDETAFEQKRQVDEIWRVRGGRRTGSELSLPQGSFKNAKEAKKFMREQQRRDSGMEFVIHRVSPEYFSAPFVGTLAVYNQGDRPGIRIELQKVTKELVDSIDKGKRPRDWEACLILDYEFLNKFPRVLKKDPDLDMDFLKHPILVIHEVGEEIFRLYEENGKVDETYTRFNIYNLGQVLFDDHRSRDSFMEKYKFDPTKNTSSSIEAVKVQRKAEKELEI